MPTTTRGQVQKKLVASLKSELDSKNKKLEETEFLAKELKQRVEELQSSLLQKDNEIDSLTSKVEELEYVVAQLGDDAESNDRMRQHSLEVIRKKLRKLNEDDVDMKAPQSLSHTDHKVNGNNSYKSKDYHGAIAHYTLAINAALDSIDDNIASPPTLASYYSNRAAAFSMLLQYDVAISDCDFAIAVDSSFNKAHFRKARTLTCQGKLQDALKAYSLGMIRDPNNAAIIKDRDEVHTLQKRYDLAYQIMNPGETPTLRKLSRKDAVQISKQMDIVLKACPVWKEAILLKTQALYHLKQPEEAYNLTTKLLRMGGVTDSHSHSNLILLHAMILYQKGSLDDSLKHVKQVLSGGDPDNKKAMHLLKFLRAMGEKKEAADSAYKSQRFQEAVTSYSEAIHLCKTNNEDSFLSGFLLESPAYLSKLHFNRASAYAQLRQHPKVIEDTSSAISLDENYLKAYIRRATSYLMIGEVSDCEKAIQDYEMAHELTKSEEQQKELASKIHKAKIQLKRAKRTDFYKVLGVSKDATESEIKKSYRKNALKWHPDRHANSSEEQKKEAEEKFKSMNLAYEVLSDPVKKKRYDDWLDEQDF